MDFTAMDVRAYRALNADQYEERRNLVLSLAEELPEDATDEQMRSIADEMDIISDEDVRRDKLTQLRNHKAAEVIGGMGKVVSKAAEPEEVERKAASAGEHFANYVRSHGHEKSFHLVAPAYKRAYSDVQVSPAVSGDGAVPELTQAITTYDKNVVEGVREDMGILGLLNREVIEGNTLVYFVEGATEGSIDVTDEATAKDQLHFATPTAKTVTLEKLAAFVKESDEYIEDFGYLASAINGRLLYELNYTRQAKVLSTLLGTSGIQTIENVSYNALAIADEIANAISDVMQYSGRPANAIVMTPAIWKMLRIGKYTGSGEYVGGGYFEALHGENIWNLPIVLSNQLSGGHVIVGAFNTCASLVTKSDGVTIEATNTDQDDFIKNLMTVRAEIREKLAVRRPAGFVDIEVLSSSSSSS